MLLPAKPILSITAVFSMYDLGYEPDDIVVKVSELMVATADSCDEQIDASISEVLRLLRDRMAMDVVFVSEFVDGQRVIRKVEQSEGTHSLNPGDGGPLEDSGCKQVVDGRMPQFMPDASSDPVASRLLAELSFPIGTHISTPIVLANGEIYGTLCCFSFQPNEAATIEDLARLQITAKLAAVRLKPTPSTNACLSQ